MALRIYIFFAVGHAVHSEILTAGILLLCDRSVSWIAIVVKSLASQEAHGGFTQSRRAIFFGEMVQNAASQLVRTHCCLAEHQAHQDISIQSSTAASAERKQRLLTMERVTSIVLESHSTRTVYMAVKDEKWRPYIGTELGNAYNFNIEEISFDITEVIPVGQVLHPKSFGH